MVVIGNSSFWDSSAKGNSRSRANQLCQTGRERPLMGEGLLFTPHSADAMSPGMVPEFSTLGKRGSFLWFALSLWTFSSSSN